MNIIEKQAELGRTIFDINTNAMRAMAELTQENVQKYMETNQAFGQRLPEVTDVDTFASLQREYGEALAGHAREAVEEQTSIVKSAFENTRGALETAFSPETANG
jgi:hypothetical protein